MKKTVFAAAAAAFAMAAPAFAWEGQTVACYDKVYVGPKYSVSKVLVKDAKTQYEHRNHRIEEVYYPPVYKEIRKKVSNGHYVMKPIPCCTKCG